MVFGCLMGLQSGPLFPMLPFLLVLTRPSLIYLTPYSILPLIILTVVDTQEPVGSPSRMTICQHKLLFFRSTNQPFKIPRTQKFFPHFCQIFSHFSNKFKRITPIRMNAASRHYQASKVDDDLMHHQARVDDDLCNL